MDNLPDIGSAVLDPIAFGLALISRWPGSKALTETEVLNRFPKRRELQKVWCIPGVLPVSPTDVLVGLKQGHPWVLPIVSLLEATNAISLPHVEADGVLCLTPKTVVYQLPVGIAHVEKLLEDAVVLVNQGKSKQNQHEFLVEANSYWQIVAPSLQSILLTKPPPFQHSVWLSAEWNNKIVVAPDAEVLKKWATATKRSLPQSRPALVVRLDTPLLPEAYPLTMGDLERFIRASGAGDLIDTVVRRWDAKALLPVVLAFQYDGKDVVLGAAFTPPSAILMTGAKHPGIPGFRTKGRISPAALFAALASAPQRFPHLQVIPIYREFLTSRTTGALAQGLANMHVVVAGCGALGGQVAVHLAQAGVGRLTLMDEDVFDWRNVGRHVLDGSYVGLNKADALKETIQKRFPDMQIDAVSATWEAHFNLNPPEDVFEKADLMVSLTADPASNQHLDALAQEGLVPPVVFGWLEPFGVAAHAIFSLAHSGGLKDCTDQTGLLFEPVTDRNSQPNLPQEASCGAFYQPYSALSALHGVALVAELAIDALLGRQSTAIHRVWVGTASEFYQNKLSFAPKWHGLLNAQGFSRRFDMPIQPSKV